MQYSTEIAVKGLGLPFISNEAPCDGTCCLCGRPIIEGDCAKEWKPATNFTDEADLAAKPGLICGNCAPFTSKKIMTKTQRCVISNDGAWPIAKDDHRAWFLLTPPEPPFVAVVSDSTLQHLIWRTPPTLHKDRITVRHGNKLLTINRPKLIDAVERIEVIRQSNDGRSPFITLHRDAKELKHGMRNPNVVVSEEDDIFFNTLSAGELWGLATLAKKNTPTPIEPDLIEL